MIGGTFSLRDAVYAPDRPITWQPAHTLNAISYTTDRLPRVPRITTDGFYVQLYCRESTQTMRWYAATREIAGVIESEVNKVAAGQITAADLIGRLTSMGYDVKW